MFKGKPKQKELTGADILMVLASEMEDKRIEYAGLYMTLLSGFTMPSVSVMLGHQAVARSDLHPHERVPENVVRLATKWAFENKQLETLKEIGDIGAHLALIWPRFLLSTTAGHPELRIRRDTPEADAVQAEDAEMCVGEVLMEGKFTDARSFIEQLSQKGLTIVQSKGDPD